MQVGVLGKRRFRLRKLAEQELWGGMEAAKKRAGRLHELAGGDGSGGGEGIGGRRGVLFKGWDRNS